MKLESKIVSDGSGPVLWQAQVAAETPSSPPYVDNMRVTPVSTFGEHRWAYPLSWASINNRERLQLNFLGCAKVGGFPSTRLSPVDDSLLLLQFKEAMVAVTCRRDLLATQRERTRYLSATGAHAVHCQMKRFFVALKLCGKRSLREVTPSDLPQLTRMLATSNGGFVSLAGSLRDLLLLSKYGLITEGLLPLDFELERSDPTIDTTGSKGWQPFDDNSLARLIELSNTYIDLAPSIAAQLQYLELNLHSNDARRIVTEWARETLPCGELVACQHNSFVFIADRLLGFVQCAAGNLVSFHTGMRISEQLSLQSQFVSAATDAAHAAELNFTTYKMVNSIHGANRAIPCHARLLDVQGALELVKDACGTRGDYLFTPRGDQLPYITNAWNAVLHRFCELHQLPIDISSHKWRKTVAALAVRVLTGAAVHLKELFGHESLAMTARYIMASPFIRDELRDLTLDEYRKRGRSLLESLVAAGGGGVGGRFGHELEERVSKLLSDTDITQDDIGKTLDELVEEMLRNGIFLLPVMPGVMCAKPYVGRGACATSSGDRLADPARCSASCAFQVQEANRRPLLLWMIRRICQNWERWGPLEQRYWAGQCRDQLTAWPDLAHELRQEIAAWPTLEAILTEADDGTT